MRQIRLALVIGATVALLALLATPAMADHDMPPSSDTGLSVAAQGAEVKSPTGEANQSPTGAAHNGPADPIIGDLP
ncbi:MAG: hypothetical protein HY334_08720 [Armatimonadetes bacterium]|nr:hypothetical protein [Armatimonadota bacterium]